MATSSGTLKWCNPFSPCLPAPHVGGEENLTARRVIKLDYVVKL